MAKGIYTKCEQILNQRQAARQRLHRQTQVHHALVHKLKQRTDAYTWDPSGQLMPLVLEPVDRGGRAARVVHHLRDDGPAAPKQKKRKTRKLEPLPKSTFEPRKDQQANDRDKMVLVRCYGLKYISSE